MLNLAPLLPTTLGKANLNLGVWLSSEYLGNKIIEEFKISGWPKHLEESLIIPRPRVS
jgi:hypothetical protein